MIEASRLALGEGDQIVGAALLNGRDAGPALDLLMARPGFRRRGISDALVGAVVEDLRERGETVLRSAYCVSNEESAMWRRAFGFEEEPDLDLARMRRMFYAHRVTKGWRRRKRGANSLASSRCVTSGAAASKSSKKLLGAKASRR